MNPLEEWELPGRHVGRRVLRFDRLDSTNTYALSLAHDPANDGLVVLADEQSTGRGQHGRSWQCPRGVGVLMSVLVFPPALVRRPPVLTAWAGVTVCEMIRRHLGVQAKIKWPNDVLIRGKKVCGTLIEQSQGTVVGLGLNVNQDLNELAAAGLTEACSLRQFSDWPLETTEVARQLIEELDDQYRQMLSGDVATLESCWKWRLGLLGKPVELECLDGWHRGRLVDIAFDAVELETSPGETVRLRPENVRHIEKA